MKTIILSLAIFLPRLVFSQEANKEFSKFARAHDSLCNLAYEKKDDKRCLQLLNEFGTKYNKLSTDDKKLFSEQFTNLYYNICCVYSLQGRKTQALNAFETCVKMGYSDYQHLLTDSDLDNIRNEPRYKNLEISVRRIGDYSYILKKAEKYNTNDKREFPKFTYQSPDDVNLIALRKNLKLDSVAGGGSDVTRIINLMHWIHNLVPHDGQHENPTIKNAMDMIAVCKKDNRGLNCRGLATVLNECYLSLGIKSRFLTCMPKDSLKTDQDCHVINMVYSGSLKKWIWIDPTNDAYMMNEKGELLGPEEVRERLINNKPLILNPDANWNHKHEVTKENYLEQYMAKNLYKFNCNLSSEYNMETGSAGKKINQVELLPLDYFEQTPDKAEEKSKTSGAVYITYKTNNPTLFWQTPE